MKQSPALIAPATRTFRIFSVAARLLLWLVLASWSLFALTWGSLHGWIVPRIGEWRPELERWASAAVGVPVKVGSIRAESTTGKQGLLPAFVPVIELQDVRLLDAQGRSALELPHVRVALSVASVWRGGVEQVVIDRPVLDVRRTAEGRIEVAGLDLSGPQAGDSAAADWFFSQREFAIRQGTVRWTDDLHGQPPLALGALDFVARNSARQHDFRLDATPPPEWGERFSLRARMRQPLLSLGLGGGADRARWRQWDGELFAEFTHVDVARLRAHVDLSRWDVEVAGGQGGLKAWGEVRRGELASATAQLALRGVQARLGPQLPELALDTIDGTVAAQWNDQDWSISTGDLRFQTAEGQTWPGGRVQVRHTRSHGDGEMAQFELGADRIDLAALGAIATRLPLGEPVLGALASLQPTGVVHDLDARWQAGPAAADGVAPDWQGGFYQAKGRVAGLSLQGAPSERRSVHGNYPLPGRPGVRGAVVDFDFSRDGGRASLSIENGTLELPDVFEDALVPVGSLKAEAVWRVDGERIELDVDRLSVSNEDAEGTAKVRWRTGEPVAGRAHARFPGVLDLSATLTRADATRVHRYLPLSVGASARRYVREALLSGGASQVDFRVRGAVAEVPFNLPGEVGEVRIAARVRNADLAYVPAYLQPPEEPPWPRLRQVSGNLVLERTALRIDGLGAGVDGSPGVRLSDAAVRIDNVAEDVPRLQVKARAQGPADEVLKVLKASPLNGMTGEALAQARMSGAVDLAFGLVLPLSDGEAGVDADVDGTVVFSGNDVRITPDSPLLGGATGTLRFSQSGFEIADARARLYGGSVRFEGGMRPGAGEQPPVLRFRGQGNATAEGLQQADLGFVSRLFQRSRGSADYTAQLTFKGGAPEVIVASSLHGLALDLPAPLNKPAEESLPLRFENTVLSMVEQQARTDRLLVELGHPDAPLMALQYERDLRDAEPTVLRGSVAVGLAAGESAPLPAQGVMANLRLGELDVDAWKRSFSAVTGVPIADRDAPLAAPSAARDPSLGYLPTVLAVRAQRIHADGRSFNGVVVGGSREGALWRANVNADELDGYVEYRQSDGGSAGSVYARLARLDLPPSAATDVEELLQQPRSVPALDIAVQDFTLANRRLGAVEIEATNVGGAGRAREWRLNRLAMRVPEARLNATGTWAVADGASGPSGSESSRGMTLDFRLDIQDAGRLLERFGRAGAVRRGQGYIAGRIGWLGSPLALDYPSLSGQLQADVASGQFLQVEPGAAKLLGVLSLQALPRRLVLDFRDVFSEGFAFDFVRGDAHIDKGVLSTNNLQMQGVNAAVLMEGTADIGREAQDLKVVVVPEINAGTAALIATAINPAVGLGTFLAQFLLREPLQSATTQEFRITGSWADPQVDKVARREPAPLPTVE